MTAPGLPENLPAVYLVDEGSVLRKADSGENHILLVLFLKENGLRFVLARRRRRTGSYALPDLFESGTFTIDRKQDGGPGFLREFESGRTFMAIARNYRSFRTAAAISRFYERNLLHLEHYQEAWHILQQALAALAGKPSPEITLLKVLYLFARSEGYPVNPGWLERLPPEEGARIRDVLSKPPGAIAVDPDEANAWTENLCRFLHRETDLLPPL